MHHWELDLPKQNELNTTNAQVSKFVSECNRLDTYYNRNTHLANFCLLCHTKFNDCEELRQHWNDSTCTKKFINNSKEGQKYFCDICNFSETTWPKMLKHLIFFCIANYYAKCIFCGEQIIHCSCAKNRHQLLHQLKIKIEESKKQNTSLLYKDNLIFLSIFINYRKWETVDQHLMCLETMKNKIYSGSQIIGKIKHVSYNFSDLNFSIQGDQNGFRICGKGNKEIPLSKCNELLKRDNLTYDMVLQDINQMVIIKTDHLNDLNTICGLCGEEIRDPNHIEIQHPSCFCNKTKCFKSKEYLFQHYQIHAVNIDCPQCNISFNNLEMLIEHILEHKELFPINKSKCNFYGPALFEDCEEGMMNPFSLAVHNLIYHITNMEGFKTWLNWLQYANGGVENFKAETNMGDRHSLGQQESSFPSLMKEKDMNLDFQSSGRGKNNFPCISKKCMENGIIFQSQYELDKHIRITHFCPKMACEFSNMNDSILLRHILSHKEEGKGNFKCTLCSSHFASKSQLKAHMDSVHMMHCSVCNKCNFTSFQELYDHIESCVDATLDGNDQIKGNDPLSQLIDLLAASQIGVSNATLSHIKASLLKQNKLAANPKLHGATKELYLELPIFSSTLKPVSIPSARLKGIPIFNRSSGQGSSLTNHLEITNLLEFLNLLVSEYNISEKSYVGLLLQYCSSDCRTQIKSMTEGQAQYFNMSLEALLFIMKELFFPLDVASIYAQASSLLRNSGESLNSYFSRLMATSRLASYHLPLTERQSWISTNVRFLFLKYCPATFSAEIKKLEIVNGAKMPALEIFRTYLIFKRTEKKEVIDNDLMSSLYRIEKPKNLNMNPNWKKNPKKTPERRNTKIRNIQTNKEVGFKVDNNTNATKSANIFMTNKKQVPNKNFQGRPQSERTKKMRAFLKLAPHQVCCFLCGAMNENFHLSPKCPIYPDTNCSERVCYKCKKYFHSSDVCKTGRSELINSGRN